MENPAESTTYSVEAQWRKSEPTKATEQIRAAFLSFLSSMEGNVDTTKYTMVQTFAIGNPHTFSFKHLLRSKLYWEHAYCTRKKNIAVKSTGAVHRKKRNKQLEVYLTSSLGLNFPNEWILSEYSCRGRLPTYQQGRHGVPIRTKCRWPTKF